MTGDRESWNQRWRERLDAQPPSSFVLSQAHHLPTTGRALDVAGGAGRHAVWLASRGLDVTIVDVSEVGLDCAARRALEAGVELRCFRADLDVDPLPAGSWDVIVVHHFLCRALWPALVAALTRDGILMLCQPTLTNLERHPSPGARFLVRPGEFECFARDSGLEVLHLREDWTSSDSAARHEAELVARRRADKFASGRELFAPRSE